MKPDLHMHTNRSDGLLSPEQLTALAVARGVTLMAVTDHDTFSGVDTLLGKTFPIPVLCGIELSLRDMKGLHLLGYGQTKGLKLRAVVHQLTENRRIRASRMLQRLRELGYPMEEDEILDQCAGTVGRLHISRALVAHGYVRDVREAFDRLLGEGRPAYVAGERLCMREALALMNESGFVPVLAHPMELGKDEQTLRTLVRTWQDQGLRGMEVYHPSAMQGSYATLDAMARRNGLLVTGGSDYHGDGDRHGQPGCTASAWRQAEKDVQALLSAMAQGVADET